MQIHYFALWSLITIGLIQHINLKTIIETSTFFRSYSTVDQLLSQITVFFTDAIMWIWPHSEFLSSNKNLCRYNWQISVQQVPFFKKQFWLIQSYFFFNFDPNILYRQRKVVLEIPFPAKQVTSAAWGGPNLDILYVTTAATTRDGEQPPLAGHLYKVTGLGVKGLPGVKVRV